MLEYDDGIQYINRKDSPEKKHETEKNEIILKKNLPWKKNAFTLHE